MSTERVFTLPSSARRTNVVLWSSRTPTRCWMLLVFNCILISLTHTCVGLIIKISGLFVIVRHRRDQSRMFTDLWARTQRVRRLRTFVAVVRRCRRHFHIDRSDQKQFLDVLRIDNAVSVLAVNNRPEEKLQRTREMPRHAPADPNGIVVRLRDRLMFHIQGIRHVSRSIARRRRVGQWLVIDDGSIRSDDEDRTRRDVVLALTVVESTITNFARRKNEIIDRIDTDIEDLDEMSGE